jgi:hypothetical protein
MQVRLLSQQPAASSAAGWQQWLVAVRLHVTHQLKPVHYVQLLQAAYEPPWQYKRWPLLQLCNSFTPAAVAWCTSWYTCCTVAMTAVQFSSPAARLSRTSTSRVGSTCADGQATQHCVAPCEHAAVKQHDNMTQLSSCAVRRVVKDIHTG